MERGGGRRPCDGGRTGDDCRALCRRQMLVGKEGDGAVAGAGDGDEMDAVPDGIIAVREPGGIADGAGGDGHGC